MKLRIVYKYKYVLELFKTKIFEDEKVPILHKTRPKMTNIRVAIVGAGAAGLAMCRYLVNEPQIDFVAFEKGSDIGGVWRYTKGNEQTVDEHNSSPMYKNLRTNLPKEVMAYPDLPFPEHLPSFITNGDVMKYLETYTEHFAILSYVKFNHQVLSVKPVLKNKEKITWDVVVKDLTNETIHKSVFDAVVVCNGHFSSVRLPEIPGIHTFPGKVIHSVAYNRPEDFNNEEVVVLGAGSSGLDIAMDLSKFSKKVYLVHLRNKLPTRFPENVQEVIGTLTACFETGTVEINHKELLHNVHSIILCTGYKYSFPFLEPECGIKVTNNHVTSLYQHIFSTKFPSLSFIGLCVRILPFLNFAAQAQCIASVLSGRTVLPSEEEMVRDEVQDYQERLAQGVPKNRMHLLGSERQMPYYKRIAEIAGVPCALTPPVHSLYSHLQKIRLQNLSTYRKTNFTIKGDEWYEVKPNK